MAPLLSLCLAAGCASPLLASLRGWTETIAAALELTSVRRHFQKRGHLSPLSSEQETFSQSSRDRPLQFMGGFFSTTFPTQVPSLGDIQGDRAAALLLDPTEQPVAGQPRGQSMGQTAGQDWGHAGCEVPLNDWSSRLVNSLSFSKDNSKGYGKRDSPAAVCHRVSRRDRGWGELPPTEKGTSVGPQGGGRSGRAGVLPEVGSISVFLWGVLKWKPGPFQEAVSD